MKKNINIKGMTCHHCEMRVNNALKELNIEVLEVNANNNNANIIIDEDFDTNKIIEAIENVGYEVTTIETIN